MHNKPNATRKDLPLHFRVFITNLRLPYYKSLNMPVAWRPDKPFREFIEDNSHFRQTEQQERYQGRVFNDKGHIREHTIRHSQHDIYEIEGSLEVQRQLLSKLAQRENCIMEKPGSGRTSSVESLESLKKDTVQAIQKTWSQSSRSTAKKGLLYLLD
jgi:hypothetical protein